jgi:hypothetical protein
MARNNSNKATTDTSSGSNGTPFLQRRPWKRKEYCCNNCSNFECGNCIPCRGKVKFGGNGKNHQRCIERICLQLYPDAPVYDQGTGSIGNRNNNYSNLSATERNTSTSSPSSEKKKRIRLDSAKADELEAKLLTTVDRVQRTNSTSNNATSSSNNSNENKGGVSKRNRCLKCPGCIANDCGVCIHCKGKRKFGGDGKCHMPCMQRYCHIIYPLVSTAGYRTRDRSSRFNTTTARTTGIAICENEKPGNNPPPQASSITLPAKTTKRSSKSNDKSSWTNNGNAGQNQSLPCGVCIGCQQTEDCGECLQCIDNMQSQYRNTTCTNQNNDKKLNRTYQNAVCYQRRCFRLLSMNNRLNLSTKHIDATTSNNDAMKNHRDGNSHRNTTTSNGKKIGGSLTHCFSLTAYLSQELEKSQVLDGNSINDRNELSSPHSPISKLYGLPLPPVPIKNVCAGCSGLRDNELNSNDSDDDDDHPVLLCDGVHCDREYHLACCVPPLSSIPDDDEPWFCYDCCTEGATQLLKQYLERNDKEKADYYNDNLNTNHDCTFVEYLIHQELIKVIKRKEKHTIPESELESGAMIHLLAQCDANKLSRTRGGTERHRESLFPNEYVGKPIRLYDHQHHMYHTGRIVAYRSADTPYWDTHLSSDATSSHGDAIMSLTVTSKSSTNIEYLIRFPAGIENRKATYHHWIVLEEHALSIGTTMVWARTPTSVQWKPAIIWLRTSLALLIPTTLFTTTSISTRKVEMDNNISKTKHKVCALVRTIGDENCTTINVRDQCVDLSDTDAIALHLYSHPDNLLWFSIARTELAEQIRVQEWCKLKQVDPMGPAVLSSHDYMTVSELDLLSSDININNVDTTKSHVAQLLPNVRSGLDRSKILRMLYRRGFHTTKDLGASITCSMNTFQTRTIDDLCFNGMLQSPKKCNSD